jgi:integrase
LRDVDGRLMTERTQKAKAQENGNGSVYLTNGRKNGWCAALTVDIVGGAPKRIRKFFPTEVDAKVGLAKMRSDRDAGIVQSSATVRVYLGDYLANHLPSRTRAGKRLSPATIANYGHVAMHIYGRIGNKRVDRLTPADVENRLLRPMADAGLSESTIKRTRQVLSLCLQHAVRRGDLPRNVAEVADIPHNAKTPAERGSLTVEQVKALMSTAQDDRMGAAVVTQVLLGLRPGEVLGLKWSDVKKKGKAQVLHVQRTVKLEPRPGETPAAVLVLDENMKTEWSNRPIALPEPVVLALSRHKAKIQRPERTEAGGAWHDKDLIFPTSVGTIVDLHNYRRTVRRLIKAAGIDGQWTSHEMRHTAISILADSGKSLDEIADLVGHKDTRMIQRTYRHRIGTPVATAADAMNELFG